jgi:hypothetical protein
MNAEHDVALANIPKGQHRMLLHVVLSCIPSFPISISRGSAGRRRSGFPGGRRPGNLRSPKRLPAQ